MNANIIKFDFIHNEVRNPIIIVYMFGYPLLIFVLMSNVMASSFGSLQAAQDFYFTRSMLFIQFSLGTMIINALIENRIKYSNLRLAYVLSRPFDIIMSKLLSLIFFNGLAIIFYIMACKVMFHIEIQMLFLKLTGTYLICGFFSMNLGLILILILRDESLTNNLFGIIQLLICILGGVFYPVCFLGGTFIRLSQYSLAKIVLQVMVEDNIKNNLYMNGGLLVVGMGLLFLSNKIFSVERLMI